MIKKIKIEVPKKKKRIPLPQKPPKILTSKKTYNRKKEKQTPDEPKDATA